MLRSLKMFAWKFLNLTRIGGMLQLGVDSYLQDKGWFASFMMKESVGKNGVPIPWCTYPFLSFIEPRLNKSMDLFEYGSGNSTLWYSLRVGSVDAVEHHRGWFEKIKGQMPQNCQLTFCELEYGGEYSKQASKTGKRYHIVIVDGRDRVNCLINSISCLTEDGVVVLDNSERMAYREAFSKATDLGFKRLDFYGQAPVIAQESCTTIFYRINNCLGI